MYFVLMIVGKCFTTFSTFMTLFDMSFPHVDSENICLKQLIQELRLGAVKREHLQT